MVENFPHRKYFLKNITQIEQIFTAQKMVNCNGEIFPLLFD